MLVKSAALLQSIDQKISGVAALADQIPSVVIIHELPDFIVRFISDKGLELLGKRRDEIIGMHGQEYFERFLNVEDVNDYVPKITRLLQQNTDDSISYFQQVRTSREREWDWYLSVTKIFSRDEDGMPLLTITNALPIDPHHHVTAKVTRLLDENTFLRNHHQIFSRLGKRECDVLRLLALGNSSAEIARELCISVSTVETHRKNIKRKLNANSSFQLAQYARAFDLI
ncbi:MAG TPA: LuxR C-terminal-related transcriptional regulator [Ohtaekwangia sp.]